MDCERDPKLDFWAKADNDFCTAVMSDVFKTAGVETVRLEFGKDHMMDAATADVICSAFRTQKLLQDFDFPVQPLGRMHFALYATPSRAMELGSPRHGRRASRALAGRDCGQGTLSRIPRLAGQGFFSETSGWKRKETVCQMKTP